MRVIVTGGAGFIGRHLVKRLIEEGIKVLVVDSLQTSSSSSLEALFRLGNIEATIGGAYHISSLSEPVDAVFHLGQPSSSPLYTWYSDLLPRTIEEMHAVLEYAVKTNSPIIYASSSSVYAGNEVPWREDMQITPWDFYSEVKYTCERLGVLYAKQRGVKFIALRLFSVYGEGEEDKGSFANLFTQLIWSALTRNYMEIYCGGLQSRDLVYVGDVVEAFIKAFERIQDEKEGYHDIFNVGTGRAVTVKEMIEIIKSRTELEPRTRIFALVPRNYIIVTQADTSKVEDELGWKARYRPEDVIAGIVDYYQDKVEKIEKTWRGKAPLS